MTGLSVSETLKKNFHLKLLNTEAMKKDLFSLPLNLRGINHCTQKIKISKSDIRTMMLKLETTKAESSF